ncbi:DNA cytosine methyltransferase, partial [Pseudomonas aeruginosa]
LKDKNIDLIIATPPCQSFSTANSRRGLRDDAEHAKGDERNSLFFEALYIIRELNPSFVLFENVPNFL